MKTYKQHIRKLSKESFQVFKDFTHYSNNLYNYSLYVIRQYYFETGKYLGLSQLLKEVKDNENYKLLPAQSSQQIVRLVDKNFRSFFALLRKKQQGQYLQKVKIPKYLPKNSNYLLIYTFQGIRHYNGEKIVFNTSNEYKKLKDKLKGKLEVKFTKKIEGKIKQVIIKYTSKNYLEMIIQYEEEEPKCKRLNKKAYLGLDLGVNNLVSGLDTFGHSFLVNGKPLKSYNKWYNQTKSRRKSILEKVNKKKISNYLKKLEIDRNNFINNYLNQVVNRIVKHCLEYNIGNVICGYNETWKQSINIGKVNNQKFVYIPYLKLKQKLEHKCNENGIEFILHEESYTSKCSFIDKERVCKHEKYLGKRVKRGLFKSKEGILVNSDINGAGNILRKVIGDVVYDQPIVGLMLNPIKLNFNKDF